MKFRLALAAPAILALAACGSADDASTEAEADTVEIPANEALEGIDDAPVIDADATVTTEPSDVDPAEEAAAEAQNIEDAGNNAADTAAEAMDAMDETE
ncbi:hypothetical protein [Qipengyuania sp. MTN3-11]|uniref:hypothetical protein n=1 Tax=Qipengyuania sp. MTN3-11 TaxID=3056557 RepID=UPI0036F1A565